MSRSLKRRQFFQKAGGVGLGLFCAMAPAEGESHRPKTYSAEGKTFEEALRKAAKQAEKSIRNPDGMVRWRLKEVTGQVGGFAPRPDITVTIEVIG